jgi:hypothetical protein
MCVSSAPCAMRHVICIPSAVLRPTAYGCSRSRLVKSSALIGIGCCAVLWLHACVSCVTRATLASPLLSSPPLAACRLSAVRSSLWQLGPGSLSESQVSEPPCHHPCRLTARLPPSASLSIQIKSKLNSKSI